MISLINAIMSDMICDSMVEQYLSEAYEIVNKLELLIMESEEENSFEGNINTIFREMHTIKGNSMMMMYEKIADTAHKIEDLFDFIRGNENIDTDYTILADIVLNAIDYIKEELNKIEKGHGNDGDPKEIIESANKYLESLKFMNPTAVEVDKKEEKSDQKYYIAPTSKKNDTKFSTYYVHIKYSNEIQMPNIRGLTSLKKIEEFANDIYTHPVEIIKPENADIIVNEGIRFVFNSDKDHDEINCQIDKISFLEDYELREITEKKYNELRVEFNTSEGNEETIDVAEEIQEKLKKAQTKSLSSGSNKKIKVDIKKVDLLMDLVGELVLSESMINESRSVLNENKGLTKAERQMSRVINDLQRAVMSIRMVPLNLTFQKMKRIVRDACKKSSKEVNFKIVGEETEVDKNVIEKIGDPLMHIIRNSIDHGIELPEERLNFNKPKKGEVILAAKQTAGNVIIRIKDDGGGLDREKILDKAEDKKLLTKPWASYSDKEVYNLLFEPGFSTNDNITELSGRGVGLDVVKQNINELNGSIEIKSTRYEGTEFIIKIPLTLAIINGVLIDVYESVFVLPTVSIVESYALKDHEIIVNNDGNEMIMIRDQVYPLIRLNNKFNINEEKINNEGIITMVENGDDKVLLHCNEILGKRQVVVKDISEFTKAVDGISGCALLGDGRISYILNPSELSA